jgi:hypothetical protein
MNGVRGFKVLLIAGSLLGSSLTLAAGADTDRSLSGKAQAAAAKAPASLVRPARKPKVVVRALRRAASWPAAFRSYERIAVNWPLFLVGTGFGY